MSKFFKRNILSFLFLSAQFKQILQITVQQHSRCLHHIIANTPYTENIQCAQH